MDKANLFTDKFQNKKFIVLKFKSRNMKNINKVNLYVKKYDSFSLVFKLSKSNIYNFRIFASLNLDYVNSEFKYYIYKEELEFEDKISSIDKYIIKLFDSSDIYYLKLRMNSYSKIKLRIRNNYSIVSVINNISKPTIEFTTSFIAETCKFNSINMRMFYGVLLRSEFINLLKCYKETNNSIIVYKNIESISSKYNIKVDLFNAFSLILRSSNIINPNEKVREGYLKELGKTINSINIIFNRFFFMASSNLYMHYVPPISDELIPICNSMVEIICYFIRKTNPSQWTEYVFVCISCLLQVGDYFGTTEILGSMLSHFNNTRIDFEEVVEGISILLWERILGLFQFLNEKIAFFFLNYLSKIPVNKIFFINGVTYQYYMRMRLLLSHGLQKDILNELSNINRELTQYYLHCNFKYNMRGLNNKHSLSLCKIANSNLKKHGGLKLSMFKSKNSFIKKYDKYHFMDIGMGRNIHSAVHFKSQKKNNCEYLNSKMFNVIKYIDSKITLISINETIPFVNVDDIVVIQPFIKEKNQIILMSFRQLAKTEEINCSEIPTVSNKNRITLKMTIKDPGFDPSEYEYCLVFPILNLKKYEKKIDILNSLCILSPYDVHLFSKRLNINISERLKFNQIQNNFRFIYGSRIKVPNTILKNKLFNIYDSSATDCNLRNSDNSIMNDCKSRKDLISLMLSRVSVSQNDLKILINLSNSQRNAIFTSLNEKITIIDGVEKSGKTLITCILAYCKKKIDKSSKILIFTNSYNSIKFMKDTLKNKEMSAFVLKDRINYNKKLGLPKSHIKEIILDSYNKYNTIILDSVNEIDLVQNFKFDHIIIDDANKFCETDILLLLTLNYHYITIIYGISDDLKFDKDNLIDRYCLKDLLENSEHKRCKLTKKYRDSYLGVCFRRKLLEKLTNSIHGINSNHGSTKIFFIDVSFFSYNKKLCNKDHSFPEIDILIRIIKSILKNYYKKQEINKNFCISAEKWYNLVEFPNISLISHNGTQKKMLSKILKILIVENSIPNWINVSIEDASNFNYIDNKLTFISLFYLSNGISSKIISNFVDKILKKGGDHKLIIIGDSSSIFCEDLSRNDLIYWIKNIHHIVDYSKIDKYSKYFFI
ncbi:hypothetical protein FG386_001593 [Cryptosporidium ryanae]|uniref:uncharacterized protein n=1 Tax=Cryptosporidium ryanae TaxID=515981 RepID=UPI00351A53CF|nr:hypothetical protein FG386_001593 [Cryptosporidium ryanae]